MTDKPCERCGTIIHNPLVGQKYCAECRVLANKEYQRQYQRELYAKKKAEMSTRPNKHCAICGAEMNTNCGRVKYCSDECRKIARAEYVADYALRRCIKKYVYAPKPVAVEPPNPKPKKSKPLNGKFIGDAFYPDVAVKQPKIAYTYNDIRKMAMAQNITPKECAERILRK